MKQANLYQAREMPVKAYPSGPSTAYPRQNTTRRGPLIITVVGAFIFFTIFFSTSSVSDVSQSAKDAASHIHRPSIPHPKLPDFHNPFRTAPHEPPVQKNSTSGEAKWYGDWKWRNPFSSTITFDENRSVLPHLTKRPPIYTYYDSETEKDEDIRTAENKLLLIWRRAWWAQGFKPIILGRAEAMQNPLYETLEQKKPKPSFEAEMMRWLAWGHMGSGILANWLVLPMGAYDDHLLSFLRRGQYPRLARYESLGNGLFTGDAKSIKAAISSTFESPNLKTSKTILEAISDPDMFWVDPKPNDIAFYEPTVLTDHYKPIATTILSSQAAGLASLAELITQHLHTTFLSSFKSGIAVLTPYPEHSAVLSTSLLPLATALTTCPTSPIPHSCPPNTPECTPCKAPSFAFPSSHTNTTTLFTLGTIPHPYTLALLLSKRPDLSVRHIRRDTERDRWLQAVTKETLGSKVGGSRRVVGFKEDVASEWGAARGVWVTAEREIEWRDLEWRFGFSLPRPENSTSKLLPLSTDPAQIALLHKTLPKSSPSFEDLMKQAELLAKGKEVVRREGKVKKGVDMREVVEAWNLADSEAWRFVRAFEARGRVERNLWEEEERRFKSGKEGEGRGESWGRWFDRI